MNLPRLQSMFSAASVFEQFPGNGGDRLFRMEISDPERRAKLRDRLTANGYELIFENRFEAVTFTVWQGEEETVYLAEGPENRLRAVATGERWAPPSETPYRKVAEPLVTQPRGLYCKADCGMVYLIRLSDGRFVLIDSGLGEYEETAHLRSLLRSQNVLPGKPVIAAWFITHRHDDHFRGFEQFMGRYADEIVLERLIYSWPDPCMIRKASASGEFDRIAASLPAETVVTPHAGQRFCFADAVFDVLFTCEDLYPAFVKNLNDTSTVLRMELGAHRAMWLGDAQKQCADLLCARYPAADLAADVLQVAHHGYWGGSQELYRRIDPEILLWPCPDFWYHEAVGWNENQPLVTSRNVRAVYLSGNEEVTLPFAQSDLACYHALPAFDPPVILREDFSGTEVRDLAWACVSGGKTGYVPPELDMSLPGEVRVTAGDACGVVTFLRQGLLDRPEGYTLTLEGRTGEVGEIGLLWNDPHPTVPDPEKILPLPLAGKKTFSLLLAVDPGKEVALLRLNGGRARKISFTPQKNCGLHLVLKNSEVFLQKILVVAGIGRSAPDFEK